MSPLRILSLNCFLIPEFLSKHSRQNNPAKRAQEISKLVANTQPNLAFLQEMWGVGVDLINQTPDYEAEVAARSVVTETFPLPRFLKTTWDWWRLWNQGNGGLYHLHQQKLPPNPVWSGRVVFPNSATPSRKGIQGTLWDVSSVWGRKSYLLMYNTHLDAFDDGNKKKQLSFMRDFILSNLAAVQEAISNHEGTTDENVFSKVALMMTGDFNIAGEETNGKLREDCASGQGLYKSVLLPMMLPDSDAPTDEKYLLRDHFRILHPNKNVDTYSPDNSLTYTPGNFGRIDYLLGVDCIWDPKTQQPIELLKITCTRFDVLKQPKGEEVSDHYPVLGEFEIIG